MNTKHVSNRQIRQAVNRQADAMSQTIAPTLKSLVSDELLTRQRVDQLEEVVYRMTFRQRVTWLVRGYRG